MSNKKCPAFKISSKTIRYFYCIIITFESGIYHANMAEYKLVFNILQVRCNNVLFCIILCDQKCSGLNFGRPMQSHNLPN